MEPSPWMEAVTLVAHPDRVGQEGSMVALEASASEQTIREEMASVLARATIRIICTEPLSLKLSRTILTRMGMRSSRRSLEAQGERAEREIPVTAVEAGAERLWSLRARELLSTAPFIVAEERGTPEEGVAGRSGWSHRSWVEPESCLSMAGQL